MKNINEEMVNELSLFIINDYECYKQVHAIAKNIAKKKIKGTHIYTKELQAYYNLVVFGMKKYCKVLHVQGAWYSLASVDTRKEIARYLSDYYIDLVSQYKDYLTEYQE